MGGRAALVPCQNRFPTSTRYPLASASLAQFHVAILPMGEDVLSKVQCPDIDAALKADLSFVYVATRVVEFLPPDWERTSLSAVGGNVRSSMLEELNCTKEATNVEEFWEFSGAELPHERRHCPPDLLEPHGQKVSDDGAVALGVAPRQGSSRAHHGQPGASYCDGIERLDDIGNDHAMYTGSTLTSTPGTSWYSKTGR